MRGAFARGGAAQQGGGLRRACAASRAADATAGDALCSMSSRVSSACRLARVAACLSSNTFAALDIRLQRNTRVTHAAASAALDVVRVSLRWKYIVTEQFTSTVTQLRISLVTTTTTRVTTAYQLHALRTLLASLKGTLKMEPLSRLLALSLRSSQEQGCMLPASFAYAPLLPSSVGSRWWISVSSAHASSRRRLLSTFRPE